jgi:formylmethanofuran dehydrogenase subunit E
MSSDLSELLKQSSARHDHLCPRQVLGVRMGLAGLAAIGVAAPLAHKDALVFIETDGCFADGIEVATGATVGHRTLRVLDYGKTGATFANTKTGQTIRQAGAVQHFHGKDIPDDEHAAVYGREDGRKEIDHAHNGSEQGDKAHAPGFQRGASFDQRCGLWLGEPILHADMIP